MMLKVTTTVFGRIGRLGEAVRLMLSVVCAMLLAVPGAIAAQLTLESRVKATYLYNFIQFVEWPEDAWRQTEDFQLCIVGADRLGAALDAFAGERVENRAIRVRRLPDATEIAAARCHMLFVPRGADSADTLARVPSRGVLTVGETPSFTANGGMINLYEVRGRVQFSINDRAVRRAGLAVSSRLMQLARERS